MSVTFNVLDKKTITKAIKDMSGPERELAKLRARDVAKAVSSISPDFRRLVALQILEEDGFISEGAVDRATKIEAKEDNTSPSVKSVFAEMRKGRGAQ